jgi:hypothetical protein
MELHQLMEHDEAVTTTFGPIEKYLAANDNHQGGSYIGLRRGGELDTASISIETPSGIVTRHRYGDFMQTFSGRRFFPMDPRADEVFIEDIAHSLAMQTRYAGHCLQFYSVAEHSVLMARHLRWEGADVALWALLHDASEAYLVDVPRPVKPYLTGYKAAEAKVMAVVCERFSLAKEMPAAVHDADERIIADELANLVPMDWHARSAGKQLGVGLKYWSPAKAKEEFLATFDALMSGRAREAA